MTNFTECEARFTANTPDAESNRTTWGWNGTIIGIERNNMTQISREGCIQLCGSEADIYAWKDISGVITTWVLPTIGILLQGPFESNAARRTLLVITRWVGSPIASLSYILWNIKVSAKAALMVDMAVEYDKTPDCTTDFGSIRDSMYLLLVMNQYTLKSTAMSKNLQKEAECLLRIALFSKDLILTDTDKTLRQMRRILAQEVRETRRRGTVPGNRSDLLRLHPLTIVLVFVSILWFLFAFALSIQDAFSELGANTTAHDLALGCLLAWFPVLIMGSIVDRNPIAAEAIRKKLSTLVDHVRHALRDKQHRKEFIETFRGEPNYHELKAQIEIVAKKAQHMHGFFVDFAGQARVRWHYGAAHAILSDIEGCYIQEKGRNWLANEREARASLVLGSVNDEGLVWFDTREFWQVISAVVIVGGSCGGAFILSYFTPTIGLGCRSGGYTIFFTVALGLLIVEMTVWMFLSPYEVDSQWLTSAESHLCRHDTLNGWANYAQLGWKRLKRSVSRMSEALVDLFIRCTVFIALKVPYTNKETIRERIEGTLEKMRIDLREMRPQRKWDLFFFRPIETFNTIWLVSHACILGVANKLLTTCLQMYIVMAQVSGLYRTCDCITSNWAWGGGYLDFSQQFNSNSYVVAWCWISGTVLTASVMGLSMIYITVEWCQQSHLSTEDYQDAMKGLRMTRTYRSWTLFARHASRATWVQLGKLAHAIGLIKKRQRTLVWTRHSTRDPVHPRQESPFGRIDGRATPSFELTDYDGRTYSAVAGTPAMAHSLFPPTITPHRTRNDSDTSVDPLDLLSRPRISDDSSVSLIQRPSQVHQQHETESRSSGEERRSFDAPLLGLGPMRASAQTGLDAQIRLPNRQGYHRAISGPELLHDDGNIGHVGLGISQEQPNRRYM